MIEKLKEIKESKSLSTEQIARELGVSWITVQRWFGGKSKPSRLAQEKIKDFIRKISLIN